jgi:uncharacterized protein (DUF1499 family)
VVIALVVLILLMQVDDWRRDFTTNHAATSADSADETLRPIRTELAPAVAKAAVEHAAEGLPNWELREVISDGPVAELHFIRTTPLIRFKDDVIVKISEEHGETLVEAESKSRVGRGDLGQNPRNLKELMRAVRLQLQSEAVR